MIEKEKIIKEIFERFAEKVYPTKEMVEKLLLGKPLRIYLGVDPTGPHLHLGHATNLLVLKKLQELGHKIIFLIGDFTARIGDPADKLTARKPLSKDEVKENLKTFKAQASKIISFGIGGAKVDFNSRWHDEMKFSKVTEIASHFTVQQMIERDMFQKRLEERKPIGLHEFLYPLMQGYDSVAMDVDAEIGGNDQTFNMLAGRTLIKIYKNKEKIVITTKLLINPETGKKLMNKSEGGLINLDDTPKEMFGKMMAIDDKSMFEIAKLCTTIPLEKIEELKKIENPRDAKLEIAESVVSLYHSLALAKKSREEFIKMFSKKELPEEIKEVKVDTSSTLKVLRDIGVSSNSEAMRLLEQGAISVDGKIIKDPKEARKKGEVIRVGKKNIFRIK